jgi:hypothetical protein
LIPGDISRNKKLKVGGCVNWAAQMKRRHEQRNLFLPPLDPTRLKAIAEAQGVAG